MGESTPKVKNQILSQPLASGLNGRLAVPGYFGLLRKVTTVSPLGRISNNEVESLL